MRLVSCVQVFTFCLTAVLSEAPEKDRIWFPQEMEGFQEIDMKSTTKRDFNPTEGPLIIRQSNLPSKIPGAEDHYSPPGPMASAGYAPAMQSSIKPPVILPVHYDPYVPGILDEGVNQLSIHMAKLMDTGKENFVFSPLSVTGALSLILLGAGGETFNELTKFLGLSHRIDHERAEGLHEDLANYFRRFDTTVVGGTVRFASGVFIQDTMPISPVYETNLQRYYQTDIQNVNFAHQGMLNAMHQINNWVANRTEGRLTKMINTPLPPDTTAVFINVLYFEGEWESPFCTSCVRWGNFVVSPTETVQVQLMPNIADAYFDEDKVKGYKILGLPYKNCDLVMYFILPKVGPKQFMNGLQVDDLLGMINKTTLQETIYVVPKMKLESTIDLNEPLKQLGLHSMFTPYADLRGISKGVFVDSVLQKVEIEITETGTKAVVSTMISTTRGGHRATVRLDKPFIFMIYHKTLRTITFWGTVYKPTPNGNPGKKLFNHHTYEGRTHAGNH